MIILFDTKEQPLGVFCKRSCSKKFCNIYRKTLCWSLFLINFGAVRPAIFYKKDPAKFLRTPMFVGMLY